MSNSSSRDYFEIEAELKKRIEGDILFDGYSRLLYSTDASIYQIEPIGVVVPRHKGDVQAVIELANKLNVSVLPRGGGTSLAGQTVGHSIVLDFSKYMQNVLEVNKEELWCRVQPGLVQDELNAYVRGMGLQFGPDTSTSNRATIGGMIGNNSAGAHSLTYGKTLDHVIELTVLLSDGSEAVLKDLSPQAVESRGRADTLEGRAYREVLRLAEQHKNEILARYPKIMRRVSGYNLDEFIKAQPCNLARIVVGSEGTLATVVEAKMRLVPKPKWTAMDVIHFNDDIEALECAQVILQTAPYAMESTDKMILNLARGNIVQSRRLSFVQGNRRFSPDGGVRGGKRRRGQRADLQTGGNSQARKHWLRRDPRLQAGGSESHLGPAQGRTRLASGHHRRQETHRFCRRRRGRAGKAP